MLRRIEMTALLFLLTASIAASADVAHELHKLRPGVWHALPGGPPALAPYSQPHPFLDGDRLFVFEAAWGGPGQDARLRGLAAGAVLDLRTETWTEMTAEGMPNVRLPWAIGGFCPPPEPVFTEGEVLFFGGRNCETYQVNPGEARPARYAVSPDPPFAARYDIARNTWRPISRVGAPSGREGEIRLWTGRYLVIFGGTRAEYSPTGAYSVRLLEDGAVYDPVTDRWTPMPPAGAPQGHPIASASIDDQIIVATGSGTSSVRQVAPQLGVFDLREHRWKLAADPDLPLSWAYALFRPAGEELFLWPYLLTDAPSGPRRDHGAVWNPKTGGFRQLPRAPTPFRGALDQAFNVGGRLVLLNLCLGRDQRFIHVLEGESWRELLPRGGCSMGDDVFQDNEAIVIFGCTNCNQPRSPMGIVRFEPARHRLQWAKLPMVDDQGKQVESWGTALGWSRGRLFLWRGAPPPAEPAPGVSKVPLGQSPVGPPVKVPPMRARVPAALAPSRVAENRLLVIQPVFNDLPTRLAPARK